jgi:hypothetical protein
MLRYMLLSALACATLWPTSSAAQIPRGAEDCSPVPSVAQDTQQGSEKPRAKKTSPKQIKIQTLLFTGQTAFTPEERLQAVKSLTERTYLEDDNWME